MKDKVFGVLQRVGKSFMLPVAILPVAGLLLGLGSSFTNTTTLETYGLMGIMGPGTFLYNILTVMNKSGSIIFENLPVIFAIGVAIGMAKKQKEVAGLAAAIAFLVMHSAISGMIELTGGAEKLMSGASASVLGITSLQMGAFGGILVGLGVAALHNKFYNIELPQALSFFGGTRFVPIISALVYVFVGIIMFYVWQPVQSGIYALGSLVMNSGYVGTFAYGLIKRLLIPFGLHHVFYLPFWQTAVGGTMEVGGKVIEGAQNIFFAQLADPTTSHYAVTATRFFSGEFIVMIFGLPGAALAMYKCARTEKKKEVGGLLMSSALTSMLTGITEPLEFSFLFVAPVLFGVHAVLTGLAYMIAHILNVGVGLTFSGGFIDLFMFGILQGNAKTDWFRIVLAGILYFVIYYFIFVFLIKKFNLRTPGREADDQETKLFTRADYNAKKTVEDPSNELSAIITSGLGGKLNISDVDCCATRLRVTVVDSGRVNEGLLKSTGAAGVIQKGNGIQVVYGPKVNIIKSKLDDYLLTAPDYEEQVTANQEDLQNESLRNKSLKNESPKKEKKHGKLINTVIIASPITGTAASVTQAPDPAFASKMMGDGAVIIPTQNEVIAPVDGKILFVFPTKHAIGMANEAGIELLIHIGMDTVNLDGKGFTTFVNDGDNVKKGDKLISLDLKYIKENAPSTSTPVLFTEVGANQEVRMIANESVVAGEDLMAIDTFEE